MSFLLWALEMVKTSCKFPSPWDPLSLKILLETGAWARLFSLLLILGGEGLGSFTEYFTLWPLPQLWLCLQERLGCSNRTQKACVHAAIWSALPARWPGCTQLQPALCIRRACLACTWSWCPWKHRIPPVWNGTFCSLLSLLPRLCHLTGRIRYEGGESPVRMTVPQSPFLTERSLQDP